MTRNTFSGCLTAIVLATPTFAAAQAPHGSSQDRHVQPPPRVTIERQRDRAHARNDDRHEQTERLTHTFRIGGKGELQVSNLAGDITITRGSGSEIHIEAIKTARARTAELAREALPGVRVDFTERAGRAEVKAVHAHEHFTRGNQRHVGVSVAYNITAPEGSRINVTSMSGSIKVTGIKGELRITSMSGHVGIFDASRVLSASSMSGNVEVGELRADMPVELRSTSGNVIVRQSRAPRLELNTVSGNVTVENVQVERVEAKSLSGDLHYTSPFALGGRYELNSHSGNVRVSVEGGSGFELDATSFSGTVQSAIEFRERTAGATGGSRDGRTRRLRGVYGDGDALLDITTFSGNVIITKK